MPKRDNRWAGGCRVLRGPLLLLLLLCPAPVFAADIAVVLSSRIRAYDVAVQAFERVLSVAGPVAGPKRAAGHTFTEILLAGEPGLLRTLREHKPDLILAVGSTALSALTGVRHIPIVYLLVPGARVLSRGKPNVAGVEIDLPASATLGSLMAALPHVRRIGLVYNPRHSTALVNEALDFARGKSLTLVAQEAEGPRHVEGLLSAMRGAIDAYWMVPDPTITTPETVAAIALFSLQNRVPVVAFSEKYLEAGATLAVAADVSAMGERAAELARRILSGTPPSDLSAVPPARFNAKVNPSVARKLGLLLSPALAGSSDR